MLERLLDPTIREELRAGCASLPACEGAGEAAELLVAMLAGDEPAPAPSVRKGGGLRRWLRYSSNAIGPSLPLALAALARDRIYYPERGRPLALVSALGVPEEDFAAEVAAAVDSFGLPHERVLVITDSFDLAALRGLGVAFRKVPSAAELELDPDGDEYLTLLDRRFSQALAPWSGKWRIKRIGAVNEALRARAGHTDADGAQP